MITRNATAMRPCDALEAEESEAVRQPQGTGKRPLLDRRIMLGIRATLEAGMAPEELIGRLHEVVRTIAGDIEYLTKVARREGLTLAEYEQKEALRLREGLRTRRIRRQQKQKE